jgi:hypothetical protein
MPVSRAACLTVLALVVSACATTPSPSVPGSPATSAAPPSAAPTASGVRSPAASASAGAAPLELRSGSTALPAGTYPRARFRPPMTFAIEDGWFPGTVSDGFFDVQRERGTPDVIAVQFALPKRVVGAAGWAAPAPTAPEAAQAIHDNPAITVIEESPSRLGGLDGQTVVVENQGSSPAGIMDVAPGRLSIDPHRRLWISLFDTTDGVVAVMIGGSVARWDDALRLAEPVLESVVIWTTPVGSPAS